MGTAIGSVGSAEAMVASEAESVGSELAFGMGVLKGECRSINTAEVLGSDRLQPIIHGRVLMLGAAASGKPRPRWSWAMRWLG